MKSYCVGARHYSETINPIVYEKINPKTKKVVKIIKGTCSICNRNKSQIFTLSAYEFTKIVINFYI